MWIEPERAVVGTPLTVQHPEWFLGEVTTHFEGSTERPLVKFRLFNFGNPAARQYMIDSMSDFIAKGASDIFQQDYLLSGAILEQADTGDRQGITEIRYVEGFCWGSGMSCGACIRN